MFKTRSDKQSANEIPLGTVPPLEEDWVYVNVDTDLFLEEQQMGWRAVLRDHDGSCLCANNGS
jgi:hypothetical protein